MLTDTTLSQILDGIPRLGVGVLGDLFLDRYLDLDARLTEPSIETGLDAYQVVRVRSLPGAAGTVINNLAALGVGRIHPISVIGDDGEGYELQQALRLMPSVRHDHLFASSERRTPTYTKPMLCVPDELPRELNRLDIKNRHPLPADAERRVIAALDEVWPSLDALLVLDQVSEPDCGVVTRRVREHLTQLVAARPDRLILADSRERVGLFRKVWLKPNERECQAAAGLRTTEAAVAQLARTGGRPVFCTRGERGILIADSADDTLREVPAYAVTGPIDLVGAGDSTSAGLACALATGASPPEAAAFANLVASITIQQLGTTGTASPAQVRQRWQQVQSAAGR